MKRLLVIALVLMSCKGIGQDTTRKFSSGWLEYRDDKIYSVEYACPDTVAALIILIDTQGQKYTGADQIMQGNGRIIHYRNTRKGKHPIVTWTYGYIVLDADRTYGLFDNKKFMASNIVVWDYKLLGTRKKIFTPIKPF